MKPTFLGHDHPLATAMIVDRESDSIIRQMKNAKANGADAFGLQLEYLNKDQMNEETFKKIFNGADSLPTYVTYYRARTNEGKTDDELAEGLLTIAKCGATLCDVIGDLFDKQSDEVARDERAIEKQMRLIDQLHAEGAEVLMSSHVLKFTPAERVLEIALEQQRRGADICKIVTGADNKEQEAENLKIVTLLKKELKIPFLYLSGGECSVLRRVGPMLGCCMWLCVDERNEFSTASQPSLAQINMVRGSF